MTSRLTLNVAAVALSVVVAGCGSAPTTATDTAAATATIDSVLTSFRGAPVESAPVTIPSPEALDVETRLTQHASPDSRVTVYVCVLESQSSIGVGSCVSVSMTAAELQQRGNVVRMGISTFKTDGVARTTNFVYVAFAEGVVPVLPGASPPKVGDTFGSNRVLATMQLARTVTFQ